MKCAECDTESPDGVADLIEWYEKQSFQRDMDLFVFGSAFECEACGARLNPTEMVVFLD